MSPRMRRTAPSTTSTSSPHVASQSGQVLKWVEVPEVGAVMARTYRPGSFGRPSIRSPTMLRRIEVVPPMTV